MSEENKDLTEVQETGGESSKKKKIIIIAVTAVVICAVVAVVCAMKFGGGQEEYTNTPVDPETTSQLTPGVENGEIVDSAPSVQGGTASSGSSGSQSGGEGQSSAASQGGQQNTTKPSGGGSGSQGGSEETQPASRRIDVWITMPNDSGAADKLFVYINGELQNEDGVDVSLNGKVYHFLTEDEYEGVVRVEASLQNYGTKASQISTERGDTVSFSMPLDGSEENFVELD